MRFTFTNDVATTLYHFSSASNLKRAFQHFTSEAAAIISLNGKRGRAKLEGTHRLANDVRVRAVSTFTSRFI